MSVKLTGQADFRRVLAQLPTQLDKIARGAAKAGAEVIAADAQERCQSREVAAGIVITTKTEPGLAVATIKTVGKGSYLAPWIEFGTDPHLIAVNDEERGGRTVGRINRQAREGSLVINGTFVGPVVHHPGARPYPFLRPALDGKRDEALQAAGTYIGARLTKEGLEGSGPSGDGGEQ